MLFNESLKMNLAKDSNKVSKQNKSLEIMS